MCEILSVHRGGKKKFHDQRLGFYQSQIKENGALQSDAVLHFYFKIDPETLNDEQYFKLQAKLEWILENRGADIY